MTDNNNIASINDTAPRLSRAVKITIEVSFIVLTSVLFFIIAGEYDLIEKIFEFAQKHEEYEIDEILTVSIYLMFCFLIFAFRWLRIIYRSEKKQKELYTSLHEAKKEVKMLQGFLPICSHCKKIRNDAGAWQELEGYIHQHSEATFTHYICSKCMKEHFPDVEPDSSGNTK